MLSVTSKVLTAYDVCSEDGNTWLQQLRIDVYIGSTGCGSKRQWRMEAQVSIVSPHRIGSHLTLSFRGGGLQ